MKFPIFKAIFAHGQRESGSTILRLSIFASLLLLGVSLLLLGLWSAPWKDSAPLLNQILSSRLKSVNAEDHRKTAISTAAEALSKMANPNAALILYLPDAEEAFLTTNLKREGVTAVKLVGDKQLLKINIAFNRKLVLEEARVPPNLRQIIKTAQPTVKGRIDLFAAVTSAFVNVDAIDPEIQLRLLPGFSKLTIDELKLGLRSDVTELVEPIIDALNSFNEYITSELSQQKFVDIRIPQISPEPINISKQLSGPDDPLKLTLSGAPVVAPVKLAGITWLTDDKVLAVLAEFVLGGNNNAPPTKTIDRTFEAISGQVVGMLTHSFGIGEIDGVTTVAVRKEFVATTANLLLSQANACVTGRGRSILKAESKIPMPSGEGISCDTNRDCASKRSCLFNANQDTRNCWGCLAYAPRICVGSSIFGPGGCTGGQCVQEGNSLSCMAEKAIQQGIYNADANLRKADCDRLREMETLACKAEEEGKRKICEAKKSALNALRRTGNFANIDVDGAVWTDKATVCLKQFNLSPGFDNIAFGIDTAGRVEADIGVKFTPLDIAGHLTCQFPWAERQQFKATLRDSRVEVTSKIRFEKANDGNFSLLFVPELGPIKARLEPGPTETLMKSPNMMISCPAVAALLPIAFVATPFVPQLRGDIDIAVSSNELKFTIPGIKLNIGEIDRSGIAGQTNQAMTLTLK